jgi:hypothetical protein
MIDLIKVLRGLPFIRHYHVQMTSTFTILHRGRICSEPKRFFRLPIYETGRSRECFATAINN